MDGVLYHFTSRYHLPLILKDGFLKLTESNLKEPMPGQKIANVFDSDDLYKPVVWLSRSANAGNCAVLSAGVDKSEILITLRERTHYQNWTLWSKTNRIKNSWAKRLTSAYNPNSWYVSEIAVPLTGNEVLKIENTKTGEIYIDVEAGKLSCRCILEKPLGIPADIFDAMIGDRDLKEGDFVEFTLERGAL
jgi:hypothetical protein